MSLTSLQDGLKASYNFNGDAKDRSGNYNHGTALNDAVIDTDNQKLGDGCYSVDGNGDYIEIPVLNFDEITVSGHFNRSSIDMVNADTVFGAWRWSADLQLNEGFDLARFTANSKVLVFVLYTKTGGGVISVKSINWNVGDTIGTYVHVVGTYNKTTGVQKLIIDGVLRATATHPAGNTIVPVTTYSTFRIGSSRVNQGHFHGYVDTFHVWNRPLLDGGVAVGEYAGEEIALLYNKGRGREIVIPAPPTRTGKSVIDGQREPLGYQQVTGLNTAKGLTVPSGTRLAVIQAEAQDVMWRDDGTDPTGTVGSPLSAGTEKRYTGDFSAITFIEQAASAKLNVSYYS